MSVRFRKSMKLAPGVRLNFNKDSVGMSFGVPGARYTINSKGRRTVSTGIPGTGIYNVETISSGSSSRSKKVEQQEDRWSQNAPGREIKPGLFASKAEKEFYQFLLDVYKDKKLDVDAAIARAAELRDTYDELRYGLELIAFAQGITVDKWENKAIEWGAGLWKNREVIFNDTYVTKYFQALKLMVTISPGIATSLIYNEQTLGFIWAEVLQGLEKFDEALDVLHEMDADQMVAISIADIEITKRDFDGAIETTEDIEVEDDATAMLMVLRGVAFREKGMHEAAVECFKRAMKQKDVQQILAHRALFERGVTYAAMGKKSMAIKDLEKILVDNPAYPEVEKKLSELKG